MGGERLATAAVAAAACALRAPREHAVVSFARRTTVVRALRDERPAGHVVDDVLRLRGHGQTALAAALTEASEQLIGSRAGRRVTVLLSDCQATDGVDPLAAARGVEELVVLAPADECDDAEALVRAAGGRWAPVSSAAEVPALLASCWADPLARRPPVIHGDSGVVRSPDPLSTSRGSRRS
jgi:Mg-chelatase subunit ChlD